MISCRYPPGPIFPSPTGKHWRSSNFNRNVLKRACLAIGRREGDGNGRGTGHSLQARILARAEFLAAVTGNRESVESAEEVSSTRLQVG
jgi:hypothetical protein